jgi:hypothetical protein
MIGVHELSVIPQLLLNILNGQLTLLRKLLVRETFKIHLMKLVGILAYR